MHAYVGKNTSPGYRLWLVDERPVPTAAEIAAVLKELNDQSAAEDLRLGPIDGAARQAAIARKHDLLSRIRASEEAPPPKLLFEVGSDAGHHTLAPAVASAILRDDLGLDPTAGVVRQFAQDLLAHRDLTTLRI